MKTKFILSSLIIILPIVLNAQEGEIIVHTKDTLVLKMEFYFDTNSWAIRTTDTTDNEYKNAFQCLNLAKKLNYNFVSVGIVCFTSPGENINEKGIDFILNYNRSKSTKEQIQKILIATNFDKDVDKISFSQKTASFITEKLLLKRLIEESKMTDKEMVLKVLFFMLPAHSTNKEILKIAKNKTLFQEKLQLLSKTEISIVLYKN